MRAEAVLNEVEFRRCKRDPAYFLSHHWSIRHPEQGRILFPLREAQLETLAAFESHDRVIILKARQIGFSTLCAGYVAWLCLFHPDQAIIMLSRTEREAIDLLSKVKYGLRYLPDWLKKRCPQEVDNTLTKLAWDNESMIESLPSQSDPARGHTVTLVIVDEWAFLKNPEEAWASIEPVADIGGRVIGLSTANGVGNFFHTLWVKATTGTSRFKPIFFPWHAVPERDQAWYDVKTAEMLPWQRAQEYPSSEDEAFIRSGNPVFDLDLLDQLATVKAAHQGYLEPDGGPRTAKFLPSSDGNLFVWEPPQEFHKYVIGADVAEGLEHGDYSVAVVIDVGTGRVVAKWRGHIDADLFGTEILRLLGWWYNCALIGVEVNNHGLTTCTHLRATQYPNIYYRTSYDQRTMKETTKIGWRTQVNTKPLLVDELARALRNTEIIVLDHALVGELRTFVREPDGKMHGSPYDDQTMALGIAVQMLKHAFVSPKPEEKSDYMTAQWILRETMQEARRERDGRTKIGAHSQRRR